MNDRDWDYIKKETQNLSAPKLFRNYISGFTFSDDDLKSLFTTYASDPDKNKRANIRFYTDGRQDRFEDLISRTPPDANNCMSDWLSQITKNENFGLILNRAERWNEKLAKYIASFTNPIVSHLNNCRMNIETVLFIGTYGYSPFGVHKDDGTTFLFHIHIGPGKKSMVLWTEDAYLHNNGSLNRNFEPHNIIDSGTTYTYGVNDLFFFPGSFYHVGITREYSAMIAIVITLDEEQPHLFNAAKFGIEKLLTHEESKNSNISLNSWLKSIEEGFHLKRKSNNYLLAPPLKVAEASISAESLISLNQPFKIMYQLDDHLDIYLRGHHISFGSHPLLNYLQPTMLMIDAINDGNVFRVSDFYNYYPISFDKDAVNFILSEFARHQAIMVNQN